jgi:hypothetical protein
MRDPFRDMQAVGDGESRPSETDGPLPGCASLGHGAHGSGRRVIRVVRLHRGAGTSSATRRATDRVGYSVRLS